MTEVIVLQRREVTAADIALIRAMLAAHPAQGRTALSAELCRRWDWRNARFLIPAWVHVQHLASHVLGLIARRIRAAVKDVYLDPLVADFRRELCA